MILLGLATYAVKVLHSPSYFTMFDEFLHLRTAADSHLSGIALPQNHSLWSAPCTRAWNL